ncbi:MAG: polysaccharide deacetylase family protein [Bryobacteraceae bacterium]
MKRAISLMYHDVVPAGQADASGFPTPDAAIYKLTIPEFLGHLKAIREAIEDRPVILVGQTSAHPCPLLFTFDDGGESSLHPVADLLEEYGWRGHFFISTDFIGTPGFLDAAQLRELYRRGHIVGSHSCSHPMRMSACSEAQLRREWTGSVEALSNILDASVMTASVPGGHYSPQVGRTAAAAGIRTLFNSEPSTRLHEVDGCTVVGRYAVQSGMPAGRCAALASGRFLPAFQQSLLWNAKKLAKLAGGNAYLRFREAVLNRKG